MRKGDWDADQLAQRAGAQESEVVALHSEHAAGLCRYAQSLVRERQCAEDLVQEAFLRLLLERSLGRAIQQPAAWMYRVVRNLALDSLRRQSRERLPAQLPPEPQVCAVAEEVLERRELANRLAAVLSGREQECVYLRAEGLAYEEIAAVLEIRVGTVGTLLARAYRKMRSVLEGDAPERRLRPERFAPREWLRSDTPAPA